MSWPPYDTGRYDPGYFGCNTNLLIPRAAATVQLGVMLIAFSWEGSGDDGVRLAAFGTEAQQSGVATGKDSSSSCCKCMNTTTCMNFMCRSMLLPSV